MSDHRPAFDPWTTDLFQVIAGARRSKQGRARMLVEARQKVRKEAQDKPIRAGRPLVSEAQVERTSTHAPAETITLTIKRSHLKWGSVVVATLAFLLFVANANQRPKLKPSASPALSFGEQVGDLKEREWSAVPGTRDDVMVARERFVVPGRGEYIIDYTPTGGVFKKQPNGTWRRID